MFSKLAFDQKNNYVPSDMLGSQNGFVKTAQKVGSISSIWTQDILHGLMWIVHTFVGFFLEARILFLKKWMTGRIYCIRSTPVSSIIPCTVRTTDCLQKSMIGYNVGMPCCHTATISVRGWCWIQLQDTARVTVQKRIWSLSKSWKSINTLVVVVVVVVVVISYPSYMSMLCSFSGTRSDKKKYQGSSSGWSRHSLDATLSHLKGRVWEGFLKFFAYCFMLFSLLKNDFDTEDMLLAKREKQQDLPLTPQRVEL